MQFVDAHCHLHFKRIEKVVFQVMEEARRHGVKHFVVNATSTRDLGEVLCLARRCNDVTPCFGIHPYSISAQTVDQDLECLFSFLKCQKEPYCIGEIGMDKSIAEQASIELQERVFRRQVEYASSHSIPFVVHCVRCVQRVYDVLNDLSPFSTPFLMHGYAGPADYVDKFAALGAFFSLSGSILNLSPRRREGVNDCIRKIPLERILFESDSPDMLIRSLADQAEYADEDGRPINTPSSLLTICSEVAKVCGVPPSTLAAQVYSNSRIFYSLASVVCSSPLLTSEVQETTIIGGKEAHLQSRDGQSHPSPGKSTQQASPSHFRCTCV